MKKKTAKQPNPSKATAQLKDLKPKKAIKGGEFTSRPGTGVLKSMDGGRTW